MLEKLPKFGSKLNEKKFFKFFDDERETKLPSMLT